MTGDGLDPLNEVWRQISNQPPELEPVLIEAKRRVLETLLTSEFTVLTRLLARISGGHYSTRDYSADSVRQALELYILHFPVYRTYITARSPALSPVTRKRSASGSAGSLPAGFSGVIVESLLTPSGASCAGR